MTNEELRDILRQFDLEEKTLTSFAHPPLAVSIGGIKAEMWVKIAAAIEKHKPPKKRLVPLHENHTHVITACPKCADTSDSGVCVPKNSLFESEQDGCVYCPICGDYPVQELFTHGRANG